MMAVETFASLQAVGSMAPNGSHTLESGSTDEAVVYLMKRVLVSLALRANRKLDSQGLTHAQLAPLMKLRSGGPSTVTELARNCQVGAAAMTRLLDRLEKKNLCKRARSTDDRRVVRVELTAEGDTAVAQVRGVSNEVLNAHLAGFSRNEWQALRRYLERMARSGDTIRDGAPPGSTIAPADTPSPSGFGVFLEGAAKGEP